MNQTQYHKNQKAADEHYKHRQQQTTDPRAEVKNIPLDEIFFVLTRSGAETFTNMISNSIQRVVSEEMDKQLRQVAEGIQKGLLESQMNFISNLNKITPEAATEPEEPIEFDLNDYKKLDELLAEKLVETVTKSDPEPESPEPELKSKKRGPRVIWTDEQDQLVIEMVKGTKQSKTKTFEELGELLDRTPAAIAFRWNKQLKNL